MENSLILCGGTGAHVGVALLRLHTLGYALGFFDQGGKPFVFPKIFLVDQDSGDGSEREPTAWQLANSLVSLHPGRFDWFAASGNDEGPDLIKVTPLPIGPNQQWFKPPHNTLASRFESSSLLPALASERQRQIDYSKGMMGSPAIGSLLFKLKEYDERNRGANHDETFGQMLKREGRIVVAGSGVGGTGASVAPTLAQQLAEQNGNRVMAVMVLDWFAFDEEEADQGKRERAQLRNRIMRENASSALEFYGQSLARDVAAVPIGAPAASIALRHFTSDVGQPIFESYIHAVAALCGLRHYLNDKPFGPGLYVMGAVERGRLTGDTAIPGGTLQDLANQAATVVDLLETCRRVLASPQGGRVVPAIYEEVERLVQQPGQVADFLGREIAHYREQLQWMSDALSIVGIPYPELTRESASRLRLLQEHRGLPAVEEPTPERVALALFHWAAQWVREVASPTNSLRTKAGEVHGGQWPDLRNEAINVAVRKNGDLTHIPDQDIAPVLEAFVDRDRLSSNGWPHPLAAADYFRHAIERGDAVAVRQLELLMAGLVAEVFQLRRLGLEAGSDPLSLESLAAEYRREGFEGLAEFALVMPRRGGQVVGFTSPHTLLCPVPYMNDTDDHRFWQEIWEELSGASDGASWMEAKSPATWGNSDLIVRQVRSWIDHQKRSRTGGAPPWTRIFANYGGGASAVPFGAGALVKVYWGGANAPQRPLIDLSLPTREIGIWVPPPGTPEISEDELMRLVPALRELTQNGIRTFWRADFEVPEGTAKVRGWWEEHLNHLLREGQIHVWSRTETNALIVGTMQDGVLKATKFSDSQVLSRGTVTITTCTPFLQDPVSQSSSAQGMRYPDVPIKAEYLDLVRLPDGRRLTTALKEGSDLALGSLRPAVGRDELGRQRITWRVLFEGANEPLSVEIRVEEEEKPHRAHWMIWPRFRTRSGAGWKAYYMYEYCSDARLFCDLLWLEKGSGESSAARLRRRVGETGTRGAYPLSFRPAEKNSAHDGGLPLALGLRNVRNGEENGVYLIPLQILPESTADLNVAVDFGTSHSVAAYRIAGDPAKSVEFFPELENIDQGLSLHLSEDRSHIEDSEKNLGVLASGTWLPTYRRRNSRQDGLAVVEGFLPSELMLRRKLGQAQSENVTDWRPAKDYTIPPLDLGRSDLAEFLLTDFKWDTGSAYFRGRERELREHYLGLFLEIAMAEIVGRSLRGFPSNPVQLTFTYPLRSTSNQVTAFLTSLDHLVSRSSASLGIPFALKQGIGIYDESRAARVTSNVSGEVCLVADLGGGTLDLFIAANNQGGAQLEEVADSVRLGGNLLLRQIAQQSDGYLPEGGNWKQGDARETETRLRTWMRAKGAAALFGTRADGRPSLRQMGLTGFEKASEAAKARILLDRYFRLVVEYLARNLVAYLVGQWFPKVDPKYHDTLRISIQLRGNGWRLRYQDESYVQATQAIRDEVRRRVKELWSEVPDNPYPLPADDRWEDASRYAVADPKAEPIRNVVGKAMSYDEIRSRWYAHTLVDLEVLRGNGDRSPVRWPSRIPFATGASRDVQLKDIAPSLVLSSPFDDRRVEIHNLDASLQGRINHSLQNESSVDPANGTYLAPVAPLVWEAVFESRDFWPEKGGR